MEDMAYTTNPFLPKVRMQAVMLVRRDGWSIRKTSRHFGVSPSTVSRWVKKAPNKGSSCIPTLSSKPKSSPSSISYDLEKMIVSERFKHGRCGNVIHRKLLNDGVKVSLSTVNRTLDRHGLLKKKSKWKRYHKTTPRPLPLNPGDLVQVDTIHLIPDPTGNDKKRWYVYTMIDVNSRNAWAKAFERANTYNSLDFVKESKETSPFKISCIQTDNGAEFSKYFSYNLGIRHRHIRVRKPTDNAHIERFNRTIQQECIKYIPRTIDQLNSLLKEYIDYYNNERMHMGIDYQTPSQKLSLMLQRS